MSIRIRVVNIYLIIKILGFIDIRINQNELNSYVPLKTFVFHDYHASYFSSSAKSLHFFIL